MLVAGSNAAFAQAKPPRVALVMKSLANEFFLTMETGAKAHQKQNMARYQLLTNGIKGENDTAGQIKLVEQMIVAQVDAIVIAPADSRALVAVVKRALDAGIVVINIDNKFDPAALGDKGITVPFVGPQDMKGAEQVGLELARSMKPGDKVGIIEGLPTAHNSRLRSAGFQSAMRTARAKVVSIQNGEWEIAKANRVAAAMLSEHPDLRALLCANDSMAIGAVAAIKSAGRTGKVLVGGFDNISAVAPMLKDGRVTATADQHAGQLAVFGIEAALKQLASGKAAAGAQGSSVETPVQLIVATK
ncbi:MAG: substrate-binding domain-containing protein [Pseudomonadota bacterium]